MLAVFFACAADAIGLDRLRAEADRVAIAQVERVVVRRGEAGIFTDYRLRVIEALKGSAEPFDLTRFGGTLDGVTCAIAGHEIDLRPGDRILVFARAWHGGFAVVGVSQGLFHVDGAVARQGGRSVPLDSLREPGGAPPEPPLGGSRRCDLPRPAPPDRPARPWLLPLLLVAALVVIATARRRKLLCLLLLPLLASSAAAYLHTTTGGGIPLRWTTASPSPPRFTNPDGSITLEWTLHAPSVPASTTVNDAGAALMSAFRTLEDIPDATIRFRRAANSTAAAGPSYPASGDGEITYYFSPTTSTNFGDITGAAAIAPFSFNASGVLLSGEVIFNAAEFSWSTTGAGGTLDIEEIALHETMHWLGGDHNVLFNSQLWWIAKNGPLRFDRTIAADDAILMAQKYPSATFATSTGSIAGTTAASAIVAAVNALGRPVAAVRADTSGVFLIEGLPPGGYTVRVHHNFNGFILDPAFPSAANFINAADVPVTVVAGGVASAGSIATTAGSPTMKLRRIGDASMVTILVRTLAKGAAGQVIRINGPGMTGISSGDFGPGITVTAGPAAGPSIGGDPSVDFTVTVTGAATPGPRVVQLLKGPERLLAPGAVFVLDAGSLSGAAGAANPGASTVGAGAANVPMLQLVFAAGPEDVRVRSLTVTSAGTGDDTLLANVKLFEDANGDGAVDAGDRRILTSAAYAATPPDETRIFAADNGSVVFDLIAETVPAGAARTFLVVADFPASGSGTFQFSASMAAVAADGMSWGDVVAVSGGSVSGGVQTFDPSLSSVSTLRQTRIDNVTDIAVGSWTDEAFVHFQGVVSNSGGQMVRLQIELQPLGTAFTGTPTAQSALLPSGTTAIVPIAVTNGTNHHWQARAMNSAGLASPWQSFGGNAETAADFGVDAGTVSAPAGLDQRNPDATSIAVGGTSQSEALVFAATGTHSSGFNVRLEVELRPVGTAFSNVPTHVGGLVASGAPATATASAAFSTAHHWQGRFVSEFGRDGVWMPFGANLESETDVLTPAAPPPVKKKKKRCGLLGIEVLGAVALAALARRRR